MSLEHDSVIASIHNPVIKRARSLLRRKGRIEERAFLVEGVRAVGDVIAAGIDPRIIFLRDTADDRLLIETIPERVPVRIASPTVHATLSEVPHPQGIVAVVEINALPRGPATDVWTERFVVVADGVRDPGNLGTLIRTAAGAGVSEFLITPESVDPFNPKCVRAAMGSHFMVPIVEVSSEELVDRLAGISTIAVTDANADMAYDEPDWTASCAVIVGGEAFGHREETDRLATAYVRIPLARGLESLNAGVAGSHVILEVSRQRRLAGTC